MAGKYNTVSHGHSMTQTVSCTRERNKKHSKQKEKNVCYLFVSLMFLQIKKNPSNFAKQKRAKLTNLVNLLDVNSIQKSLEFLCTNSALSEKEIEKVVVLASILWL